MFRLRLVQLPWVWSLIDFDHTPPSFPTNRVLRPPAVSRKTACWSGCVCWWLQVPSNGVYEKHFRVRFQYGPSVFQLDPPLVVSQTSSRPRYTWFGSAGSTA